MLIRYILKFDKHIGGNSNCRKDFYGYKKIDAFTLSKNLVKALGKNQPLCCISPSAVYVIYQF